MGSLDGEVLPLDELHIPADDRGFLLGDGVYETLRTYGGRLFDPGRHFRRLAGSLEGLRMRGAPATSVIHGWVRAAVHAAALGPGDEAVVRVTVTRGSGGHGLSSRGAGPCRVVVLVRPLPAPPRAVYDAGLRVVTAGARRIPRTVMDPRWKTTSAAPLVLARAQADDEDADDALLCDAHGAYLEATAANLFVVEEGTVWSPSGGSGVLEGVTATHVTRFLVDEGYRVESAPVPRDVVARASEMFITQTTREVVPVTMLDGRAIGSGRPGPVARRAREWFLSEVPRWLDDV